MLILVTFSAYSRLEAQTVRPGASARQTSRATTGGIGGGSAGFGGAATGPRQYRSNTMLGDATIQIDAETRSLVVVTDDETHGELLKVIKTLDQPKPQVLIKVVFVEVTYNRGSDIGVEGSYTFNLQNAIPGRTGSSTTASTSTSQTGSAANPGTRTTTSTVTTPLDRAASLASTATLESVFGLAAETQGTFVRLVTDDWAATLRAMATHGKVEVLSRPSIMARNNQEAVIVVGQEVPFVTNTRTDALGQIINTIQYDNIGIILRVTPFITSEGTVEMIVAPEISSLTAQTVPISNTASAPVISKRSAETVVVTPNGQTVVIGGLMETQKIESVRKFPILGDIPLIGLAFKRTIKDTVKRELLIFLTPHIVQTREGLRQLTSSEAENSQLMRRAFKPAELDRYLDLPRFGPEVEVVTESKEVRKAVAVPRAGQTRTDGLFPTEAVKTTEKVSVKTSTVERTATKPAVSR